MKKQEILDMFGGFIGEFNRDFEAVWANYCASRLKAETGLNIYHYGTSSPYCEIGGFNKQFTPSYYDTYEEFKYEVLNFVEARTNNMEEAVIITNHAREFRMLNVLPEDGRITGKFRDVITLLEVANVPYSIRERKNGKHKVTTDNWQDIINVWQICRKI